MLSIHLLKPECLHLFFIIPSPNSIFTLPLDHINSDLKIHIESIYNKCKYYYIHLYIYVYYIFFNWLKPFTFNSLINGSLSAPMKRSMRVTFLKHKSYNVNASLNYLVASHYTDWIQNYIGLTAQLHICLFPESSFSGSNTHIL